MSPRGVRGERPWLFGYPHGADGWKKLHAWLGLSAGCAAVVEHLLSEPPRRMKSERKGRCPGTARRPQPSAARTGRGRWRSPCPGQRPGRAMRRSRGGFESRGPRHACPAQRMNTTRPHHATVRPRDNALLRRAEANDTSTLICCRAQAHGPTKAQRAAPHSRHALLSLKQIVRRTSTDEDPRRACFCRAEGKRSKAGWDPPA